MDTPSRCGCGNEAGKYKHLVEEAKSKGEPLEPLFDKLGLDLMCCRVSLTSMVTRLDYMAIASQGH